MPKYVKFLLACFFCIVLVIGIVLAVKRLF